MYYVPIHEYPAMITCAYIHTIQNLVNGAGLSQVNAMAAQTESAFLASRFAEATQLWSKTEDLIEEVSTSEL